VNFIPLNHILLNVILPYFAECHSSEPCFPDCHSAELGSAECHSVECHFLSHVLFNVILSFYLGLFCRMSFCWMSFYWMSFCCILSYWAMFCWMSFFWTLFCWMPFCWLLFNCHSTEGFSAECHSIDCCFAVILFNVILHSFIPGNVVAMPFCLTFLWYDWDAFKTSVEKFWSSDFNPNTF